jgi:MoaA/NifB/PqqE/SkfB family radical SAM enzyme
MESIMLIKNYKNERFIKWIVNNNCNYNCSYCFEKDFHKKNIDIYSVTKTAYKINDFVNKNNLTSIILLGGELFLLNKKIIFEILDILKNKKLNLYIITNFSKENSVYKKVYDFAKENFNKVEYKFSFHDEYISIENFFNKVENFLSENKGAKVKLQFTLTVSTEKYLQEFLNNVKELKSKEYDISEHIEKAYSFKDKERKIISFSDTKVKLSKIFNVDKKEISAEELFKFGPLDNYGAKCYQPFFHLENNILYSHCYGRIITKDFLNYNAEKINFNFICNRHSCLIYKTSIIQKIS